MKINSYDISFESVVEFSNMVLLFANSGKVYWSLKNRSFENRYLYNTQNYFWIRSLLENKKYIYIYIYILNIELKVSQG